MSSPTDQFMGLVYSDDQITTEDLADALYEISQYSIGYGDGTALVAGIAASLIESNLDLDISEMVRGELHR